MHSSDRASARRWLPAAAIAGPALLLACSAAPIIAEPTLIAAGSDGCKTAGPGSTPGQQVRATALARGARTSPLYLATGDGSPELACEIRIDAGAISIAYRFANGGHLQLNRDDRIEYTEQDAQLVVPPKEPGEDILARAERAAFGAAGCGIDYRHGETRPAQGEAGTVETVLRGDVCNCQARVRKSASGRVMALLLRSSC